MNRATLCLAVLALGCSRPSPGAAGAGSIAADSAAAASPAGFPAGPAAGRASRSGGMEGGMMGGRVGSMPMMGVASADTSAAPKPRASRADAGADCPPVDQGLVDQGRAVFSSTGNCYACHGAKATGTALAPNLTDAQWLNITGSYPSIATLVRTGVPKPKQYAAPMPPQGGAALSGTQVCAVAAYIYSLSHP